jgi:hypothetical protein
VDVVVVVVVQIDAVVLDVDVVVVVVDVVVVVFVVAVVKLVDFYLILVVEKYEKKAKQ